MMAHTNLSVFIVNFEQCSTTTTYKPYKKPNDETKYIHVGSDHPPSIIKQIPKSIATRLSSLSSSKEIFLEAAQSYEQNLANCGYN